MPEPETEELQVEQIRRAREERARADSAADDTEERQHIRRADKAAYLKERLDERARSEDRVQHRP